MVYKNKMQRNKITLHHCLYRMNILMNINEVSIHLPLREHNHLSSYSFYREP